MRVSSMVLSALLPVGIALAAFLNGSTVSTLVGATLGSTVLPSGIGEASCAVARTGRTAASADAILDRNPFDHVTGSLREREIVVPNNDDPRSAPPCEGVRPVVLVGAADQAVAFAALEVDGKHVLRRQGGDVGGKRVVYVGRDRVWLEGAQGLCQARLFAGPPPRAAAAEGAGMIAADPLVTRTALEQEVQKRVVKSGPNEFQLERGMVERILEAQQELMKARLVPDKEGDRIVGLKIFGIKPESVLGMLGIENGDRLETINGFEFSNPEKMLEAYARLRGADRLSVHLSRRGRPLNVDYIIR